MSNSLGRSNFGSYGRGSKLFCLNITFSDIICNKHTAK